MIPRRILFCTDFSENSRNARQYAIEYAKAFKAQLHVLHVINSSQIGYPSMSEAIPIDIRAALEGIEESVDTALSLLHDECASEGAEPKTHTRIGLPAYEIVDFANENSIELIVMGTHGWTGLKHLVMGSTAENVVRTATCPVLSIKPGELGKDM